MPKPRYTVMAIVDDHKTIYSTRDNYFTAHRDLEQAQREHGVSNTYMVTDYERLQ